MRTHVFGWALAGLLTATSAAHAEWYIGGYGGLSYPGAFSNVTLSDPAVAGGVSAARVADLELKGSMVGGVKAGYFFENRPWLGLEGDVFTLKPDVKQQVVVGGTASGRVFADTLQRIPLQVTTTAANLIIRSPSMSEVFQPYGGMGYALFIATSRQADESNVHLAHGFNLFAGARYVLSPHWALFGEFKFNRAKLRFSQVEGNYETQNFVFGLMWHFGK